VSALPPLLSRRHAARWAGLLACGLAIAACAGGAALAVRLAFDGARVDLATPLAATLAACAVVAAAVTVLERRLAEALAQAHVARIRRTLVRALFDRRPASGASAGTAMLRFVGDLGAIREWVANGAAAVPVALVVAPSSLALLAWLSPALALPAALAALLSILLLRLLGARLESAQDAARRDRVRLARTVSAPLSNPAPWLLADEERRLLRRLRQCSQAIGRSAIRRRSIAATGSALSDAAMGVGGAATLWLGLDAVGRGGMDTGALAAALTLSGFLGSALHRLASAWDKWHAVRVADSRLTLHLDRDRRRSAPRSGLALPPGPIGIAVSALRLRPGAPAIDLDVAAGEIVCVHGEDRHDGERLLRLLAGLDDAPSGRIAIGDVAIESAARSDVRRAIAVIGTIAGPTRGSLRGHLRRAAGARARGAASGCTYLPPPAPPDPRHAEAPGPRFGRGDDHPEIAALAQLGIAAIRGARIYLLQHPTSALDDLAIAQLLREARRQRATVLAFGGDQRLGREADRVLLLHADGLRPVVATTGAPALHQDTIPG
jgi:ABC-type multidrug transport system fused ATPase/permease subunit